MYETNYTRAKDAADAAKKIRAADDGKFISGGMTLLPHDETKAGSTQRSHRSVAHQGFCRHQSVAQGRDNWRGSNAPMRLRPMPN